MKFLVRNILTIDIQNSFWTIHSQVLAACVAAASGRAQVGPHGLQSFPNGAVVPVDEPAVAAARADHFAAKAAIAGPLGSAGPAMEQFHHAAGPAGFESFHHAEGPAGEETLHHAAGPAGAQTFHQAAGPAGHKSFHHSEGPAGMETFHHAAGPFGTQSYHHAEGPAGAMESFHHNAGPAGPGMEPFHHNAGPAGPGMEPFHHSSPYFAAAPYAYDGFSYAGPLNLNTQLVAHPNGAVVPADEPAVAAARADHLAAKGHAYNYFYGAGPAFYGLQFVPNGVHF